MNKHVLFFKKIFKRLVFLFINILILAISTFIPKTDKIIIVGGWFGKRFADNSKYFYLYANKEKKKLNIDKIVWITRSSSIRDELKNNGYTAYKTWSLFSIWYHLRAKVHLIDQSIYDINPYFSVKSIKINLWHGFPLKKIGSYQKNSKNKRLENILGSSVFKYLHKYSIPGFWAYSYLLAPSKFSAEILGKAFEVDNSKLIISGYPRNYEAVTNKPVKYISVVEKKYLKLIKKMKSNGSTIIGYFPTFRDKKETLVFGTQNYDELKGLFDYFQELNIKVISKLHFVEKTENINDVYNHESVINLPYDTDIYTFLSEIDLLITDYSSIYYDFLIWEKPIIFYPYDLEYYCNEDRGLIFNYDDFTPGDKVFSIKELREVLKNGIDSYKQKYHKIYSEKARILARKIFGKYEKANIEDLLDKINKLQ